MIVFKYCIKEVDDTVFLKMPRNAEVIHVAAQSGMVCLWAKVDPDMPLSERKFYIRGTGWQPVNDDWVYYGTAHVDPFVWHVFGEGR